MSLKKYSFLKTSCPELFKLNSQEDGHPCFSRMRSEGFPFIVWGSGGWTLVRLESRRVIVGSSSAIPCLWGKLQNLSFLKVSTQVLRGRRGTLWHSNLFDHVSSVSKLEDVSHEMLVLLRPRVSSWVSGFLDTSPCLWGKLQNLSFWKVSRQVVMSFRVAGVALCDIPTCLIMCRECQNWKKSRTKWLFCCAHVSRLEPLVF